MGVSVFANERVALRISPRVTKSEVVPAFCCEYMSESQLKPLLTFGHSVLLDRQPNSTPQRIIVAFEYWDVSLAKKFDLIAHIDHNKIDCGSDRNSFYCEVKPGFVRGVWVWLEG